jgi:PD-(D/E)XK nuclease superfamily protein
VSEVKIMSLFGPTKKQLGERSQAHIIARLLEVGYTVLTPYGDSSRYDLVIEDAEGQFWRVQCKTAWIENGDASIQFAATSLRTRSTNGKVKYSRAGYVGQVEYFAVYSHELHKTYLIPASHLGNATRMRLRLVPSKNNQEKGVKWARDYEL